MSSHIKSKIPKSKRISARILRTELWCLIDLIVERNYGMAEKTIANLLSRLQNYDWESLRKFEKEDE